jgi:hypothetical protein
MEMNSNWSKVVAILLVTIAGSFVSIIISPTVSKAALIGIDSRNGMYDEAILATGDQYETFRATMNELGHTFVPIFSFETADLIGLDSLMLKQPNSENNPAGFSNTEISAIHSFVDGGGGLVVHAEGGNGSEVYIDNLNSLVSPYGVIYADSATENSGHTITDLLAHPVTDGVTVFGVDYQRSLISIDLPAIDLTIGSGMDDALAVVNGIGHAGNVVMLSDTTMWKDLEEGSNRSIKTGDNQLLLENIVLFTIPEPATISLLCLGSLVLLRKRKTSQFKNFINFP